MFPIKKVSTRFQMFSRFYSQVQLSSCIAFNTNEDIPEINKFTLSNFENEGRSLVVIFPWLAAKPKSVQRFTDFYLSRNFDVLTLHSTTLSQLLKPNKYDKIIETQVLPSLLSSTTYQTKLVHGFSVGGYVFSRTMKQIRESGKDGEFFLNSIRAQVWDSVADLTKVSRGAATTALPSNSPEFLRKAFMAASDIYMKTYLKEETKYYHEGQHHYLHIPVKASVLFLISEADNLVSLPAIKECRELWETKGIDTELKLWTKNEKVGHLQGIRKDPNEYKNILTRFLETNGFPVQITTSSSNLYPNYVADAASI